MWLKLRGCILKHPPGPIFDDFWHLYFKHCANSLVGCDSGCSCLLHLTLAVQLSGVPTASRPTWGLRKSGLAGRVSALLAAFTPLVGVGRDEPAPLPRDLRTRWGHREAGLWAPPSSCVF